MNKEGNILGSCAKLYNSREGFEQFVDMIEGLKVKHHLRDVLMGREPTGHYWRKLAYFTKEHGYEVRFMRTMARFVFLLKVNLKLFRIVIPVVDDL
jgi:hypothetical protein